MADSNILISLYSTKRYNPSQDLYINIKRIINNKIQNYESRFPLLENGITTHYAGIDWEVKDSLSHNRQNGSFVVGFHFINNLVTEIF